MVRMNIPLGLSLKELLLVIEINILNLVLTEREFVGNLYRIRNKINNIDYGVIKNGKNAMMEAFFKLEEENWGF